MLMGFPVGYSEVPKLVLHLLFLLTHLRRLSSWLLRLTGIDIDSIAAADVWPPADADHLHHQYYCDHGATDRLEEHSPAVRFDALPAAGDPLLEGCAVCLGDFHAAAEVRRARGCRHVFHRACLDRWAAHGHRTCPLCRTAFLPLPLPLPAS